MKSAAKKTDSSQSSSPFRSKGTNKGFFSVQARLKVNTPGDAHEVEADRAAEKVVSKQAAYSTSPINFSAAPVQAKADESIGKSESNEVIQEKPLAETLTPFVQRKEEVPEPIQAKEQETGPAGMEEKSGEQDPIQAKEAPLQLKEEEAVQAKEDTVQLKKSILPSQETNIQEKPAVSALLPPVQRKEEESEPVQLQEDETIQAKEEDQVQMKESVSPAEESIVQEKPVLAPVVMPPLQRKEEESEPVQLQEDETIQAKEEDQVQMKESVSPAEESIVQEKPVLTPVVMPPLQRKEEEDEPVQAKGLAEDRIQAKEEEVQAMESAGNVTSDTGPSVEQQLYNSKGGGSPLSEGVKTEMETGFDSFGKR